MVMHILLVTPYFYPNLFGGVQKVVFELAKHLTTRGYKVDVWTSNVYLDAEKIHSGARFLNENLKVVYFDAKFHRILNRLNAVFLPRLHFHAYHNLTKYDVIHLHGYRSFTSTIIARTAEKVNKPYLITLHGSFTRNRKKLLKTIQDNLIGHRILHQAEKIIALSLIHI